VQRLAREVSEDGFRVVAREIGSKTTFGEKLTRANLVMRGNPDTRERRRTGGNTLAAAIFAASEGNRNSGTPGRYGYHLAGVADIGLPRRSRGHFGHSQIQVQIGHLPEHAVDRRKRRCEPRSRMGGVHDGEAG
jgi:hypothetical protein